MWDMIIAHKDKGDDIYKKFQSKNFSLYVLLSLFDMRVLHDIIFAILACLKEILL